MRSKEGIVEKKVSNEIKKERHSARNRRGKSLTRNRSLQYLQKGGEKTTVAFSNIVCDEERTTNGSRTHAQPLPSVMGSISEDGGGPGQIN